MNMNHMEEGEAGCLIFVIILGLLLWFFSSGCTSQHKRVVRSEYTFYLEIDGKPVQKVSDFSYSEME